jgi:heat shock protein HtpX
MGARATSWKKLQEPLPRPRRRDQAVMVGALVISALVLVASVAGLVLLALWLWVAAAFYVIALGGGWLLATLKRPSGRRGSDEAEAQVRAALIRLCVVADMPTPEIRVWRGLPPLSWTTQLPFGRPRVHVSEAMVERTDDRGLEAVLAHELAHIANGDARIMTVLAGPALAMLTAFWSLRHVADMWWGAFLFLITAIAALPALVLMGLARLASRHRELAADRGAAVLTGSPAGLAAVLVALNDGLARVPVTDLRVAARGDVFHLLPVREAKGVARLWATHPPLRRRVAALQEMETHMTSRSQPTR